MKKNKIPLISAFFIFILISLASNINALVVSPGSLMFELNPGDRQCKNLTFYQGGFTSFTVTDKWSRNPFNINANTFTETATNLGLKIEYTENIPASSQSQESTEICITKIGPYDQDFHHLINTYGNFNSYYKGIIVFTPPPETNVIVATGIWLFVNQKTSITPPIICTQDYAPVCCNINGDSITKSNECTCTNTPGIKLYDGECKLNNQIPEPKSSNALFYILGLIVLVLIIYFFNNRKKKRR